MRGVAARPLRPRDHRRLSTTRAHPRRSDSRHTHAHQGRARSAAAHDWRHDEPRPTPERARADGGERRVSIEDLNLEELRARLNEAESNLQAIHSGEIDALLLA